MEYTMTQKNDKFCTLQEAVNWILVGNNTEKLTIQYIDEHREEYKKASKYLILGIASGKVRIFGRKDIRVKPGQLVTPEEAEYLAKNHWSYGLEKEKQIKGLGETIQLGLPDNAIMSGTDFYLNIKVSWDDLITNFPHNPLVDTDDNDFYQSEYMQIMIDVIKTEGITESNPFKTEVLTKIFADRIAQAGLPKSDKLSSAMATLVRPAKAQGGRKNMG